MTERIEAGEAAFDPLALPIDLGSEGGWPPVAGAIGGAASDLVIAFRADEGDPPVQRLDQDTP
ncbi:MULTISPECIES: hypothetical protein [unclassified Amycolatopsis]|uniref:hypothetical protein n=1 Tax=unclassified Amycolatopsis TaxID=2618356 RepID=UPI002875F5C4|nr:MULTISPECIES: hypothetical protein [unclassified Amycolatopsis]MDS0134589.1 hypothetical protein [Amycolatopsis sp. 505]MDS0147512.1 hypothetical protein [Amycolatopsis sp. CM201R]